MSSVHGRPARAPASLTHFGNHKVSLLEKANPGIRRSTPDSEVLASDDDEGEHRHAPNPQARQVRRASWLNEVALHPGRKTSNPVSTTYSPNNSLPPTPSADLAAWPPASSSPKMTQNAWQPGSTGTGASFPWQSGIWENKKEPPARLQEVMSAGSPTATTASIGNDIISPSKRGGPKDGGIPFQIPLHPTPKTYRSQSYSVGQLDPDNVSPSAIRPLATAGRGRGMPAGLQHRSSRPSVLGDLGRVREVEDDENEDSHDQAQSSAQARIEQLTKENARLRQAANDNRFRDRTGSTISTASGFSSAAPFRNRVRSAYEGSEAAVDDHDDNTYDLSSQVALRRLSEQLASNQAQTSSEAKRAQWQTSLGFGGVPEAPQSRRHSFADVPTRQGSISSNGKALTPIPESATKQVDRDEGYGTYGEEAQEAHDRAYFPLSPHTQERRWELEHLHFRNVAEQYFAHPGLHRVPPGGSSLHQAYVSPSTYGRADRNSPSLYIVTFKCCRSEVFYIQEGTGLHVKEGDLVIVEADRGTDLGTVANADIGWEQARHLKEWFDEEHYKWLMLFSQQSRNGGPNPVNPNGLGANGAPGSAVGGMGPPGTHGPQDPQAGELKPKLIRRLAQSHEIQTLRDKEGNEARAKRVCQQKVVEHRLNMEILDAEFQMDWKKLTFYYFADAYINFNSLVTDLFKVYKTRIWMSAINPASFVTPTSSLSMPPPFAQMPQGRSSPAGRRRQPPHTPTSAGPYPDAEALRPLPSHIPSQMPSQGSLRSAYFNPYQGPGNGLPPHEMSGYPPASYGPLGDPFSPYAPSHHFQGMLDPNAPTFSTQHQNSDNRGERSPGTDWNGNFQGLTLGGA